MASPADVRPFRPLGATATIAATSASAATALGALARPKTPEIPLTYRVVNAGPGLCWVMALSASVASSVTSAAVGAIPVPSGNTEVFGGDADTTHIGTLSVTSSTVYVTPGQGS